MSTTLPGQANVLLFASGIAPDQIRNAPLHRPILSLWEPSDVPEFPIYLAFQVNCLLPSSKTTNYRARLPGVNFRSRRSRRSTRPESSTVLKYSSNRFYPGCLCMRRKLWLSARCLARDYFDDLPNPTCAKFRSAGEAPKLTCSAF